MTAPQTATGAGTGYTEDVQVWYRGTGKVWTPVPHAPWSSYERPVTCPHRHEDPGVAARCGEHLARREAEKINRDLDPGKRAMPCDLGVGEVERAYGDEPGFLLYCRSHQALACSTLRQTREEALADKAECPWAGAR